MAMMEAQRDKANHTNISPAWALYLLAFYWPRQDLRPSPRSGAGKCRPPLHAPGDQVGVVGWDIGGHFNGVKSWGSYYNLPEPGTGLLASALLQVCMFKYTCHLWAKRRGVTVFQAQGVTWNKHSVLSHCSPTTCPGLGSERFRGHHGETGALQSHLSC